MADLLTKALINSRFEFLRRSKLGVFKMPSSNLREELRNELSCFQLHTQCKKKSLWTIREVVYEMHFSLHQRNDFSQRPMFVAKTFVYISIFAWLTCIKLFLCLSLYLCVPVYHYRRWVIELKTFHCWFYKKYYFFYWDGTLHSKLDMLYIREWIKDWKLLLDYYVVLDKENENNVSVMH